MFGNKHRGIIQWSGIKAHNLEVEGSNPSPATIKMDTRSILAIAKSYPSVKSDSAERVSDIAGRTLWTSAKIMSSVLAMFYAEKHFDKDKHSSHVKPYIWERTQEVKRTVC